MMDNKKPKPARLGTNPLDIFKEIKDAGRNAQENKQENVDGKTIKMVPLDSIHPDLDQPRKNISSESESLHELARSIEQYGFINFITVREESEGHYIIVAGERRFTAAKIAGLQQIPVIVVDKTPIDYALIQLEENLQREDLDAFEELAGYNRLQQEFGLQQKDVVEFVSKSKSYISKMLSINKLSRKIKEDIGKGQIEVSRDILWEMSSFPEEDQDFIWKKIRDKPVRSVLNKAANQLSESREKKPEKKAPSMMRKMCGMR